MRRAERLGRDQLGHEVRRPVPQRRLDVDAHGSGRARAGPRDRTVDGHGLVRSIAQRRRRTETGPGRGATTGPVRGARSRRTKGGTQCRSDCDPQGWKGEYDGWDPADAWARTVDLRATPRSSGPESEWTFDHFTTAPEPIDEMTFESFSTC